jgi:hypothetical protein
MSSNNLHMSYYSYIDKLFDNKTFLIVSLTASGLYYLIKNRNKKLNSHQKFLKNITYAASTATKLCTVNYIIPKELNYIKCGFIVYGSLVYLFDFVKKYIFKIDDEEYAEPISDIIKQNKVIFSTSSSNGTSYNCEYNLTIPLLLCFTAYNMRN